MSNSSQKFIARNRAPRVQIEYDVELYGAEKKVQLPFVMGVMADLSGKSDITPPPVPDRAFLEIDVDNFDSRMKAMRPRAAFSVPNTLTGEGALPVDLVFERMEDFSPAAIAARVEPLRALYTARRQLADLVTYMDGKAGAEALIETLLQDPGLLGLLSDKTPVADAVSPGPAAEALAALRAAAPAAVDEVPDATASALAALREMPVSGAQAPDPAAEALAALRAAPVSGAMEPDPAAEALAALRTTSAVHDTVSPDPAAAALAALRAAGPVAAESAPDPAASALAALRAAPVSGAQAPDPAAEALAALRSISAVVDTVSPDPAAAALAALRAAGPVVVDAAPDPAASALAALRAAPVSGAQVPDPAAEALAELRSTSAVVDTVSPDPAAVALAALRAAGPVVVDAAPDPAASALAALRAAPVSGAMEPDNGEETLCLPPIAPPPPPDALEALDALLAAPEGAPAPPPDALDALDALLAAPEDAPAPPPDALDELDALLAAPEDAPAPPPDALDELDALLAAPEDTPAPPPDALDELDALLAAPEDALAPPPDALDELDALLAAPEDALAPPPDALAALDALLAAPEGAPAPPPDAQDELDALLAAPEDLPAPPPDALDALDALLTAPEAGRDPLDELEALLAAPAEAFLADEGQGGPDPLAEIDAMLADIDRIEAATTGATMSETVTASGRTDTYYGALAATAPRPDALRRKVFRLAVLGDFSGRAAGGQVETGQALVARRARRLDVDTVEDVIAGFATTLVLPIGAEGQGIEVPLRGIDDLHPDELADNVAMFDEMKGLRQRLTSSSMSARAVAEMQGWAGTHSAYAAPTHSRSAASAVPADRRLSEFQRLIGGAAPRAAPSPAADLIARVVGPYILPGPAPEARALRDTLDAAMGAAMRLVLHHPEFQAIEAAWRSLDLLARQVETDETLEIVVHDISAEEFAADLGGADDLAQSGVFQILNEPLSVEGGVGYSAVIGLYAFEETPPHAELLGRMGTICAHVQAPFVAGIAPGFMDVARRDRHPLVARAWDELRASGQAAWLALAAPRFLLRRPYGAKSDPIDAFEFEEFSLSEGLGGMLWCNPAVLVGVLLARAWTDGGPKMTLGGTMSLGQMPYHIVTDVHGDQVALPCTERNVTTDKAELIMQRGFMPVVSIRGRDVVRLGSFQSLSGALLAGPWSANPPPVVTPAPPRARAPDLSAVHAPAPGAIEDELDALLAGFGENAAPVDPAAIDADLAALLEGL